MCGSLQNLIYLCKSGPTKQWRIKYEHYVEEFASRGEDMPDVFMLR